MSPRVAGDDSDNAAEGSRRLGRLWLEVGAARCRLRVPWVRPALGCAGTGITAVVCLCVLVGWPVLSHPGDGVVGWNPGSDFQVMTWSLMWWPWAIGHGVDPLRTQLLWAPGSFPTIWLTSIPAVSLLASPLTLTLGLVATYNLLMVTAIGLAAACAYLLCFELTRSVGASVVGGLMFGLSPYMLGHTASQHLDLTFVWPIPLIAWAIVRLARGRWQSRGWFVVAVALLLVVELGSSLELFLGLTLVLALAFAIALAGARGKRHVVVRLGAVVGLAYCAASPLILGAAYLALTSPHAALSYPPASYSIDLANTVVPTPLSLFGTAGVARGVTQHFVGNIGEQDGYLGLPALVLVVLATRACWRQGTWLAASLFVGVLLLSLGPMLYVGGHPLLGLPFATTRLPLLGDMLPARLSLFTALLAAILVAVWLANERRRWPRLGAGALVLAFLLPNFVLSGRVAHAWAHAQIASFSTAEPPTGFVAQPGWTRLIRPGETILVLPTGDRTASLYWQAEGNMRFRLAIPATPFVPPRIAAQPTVLGLVDQTLPYIDGRRLAAARLRSFLAEERIGAVVTPVVSRFWGPIVARATDSKPQRLAGSLVYRTHRLPAIAASGGDSMSRAGTRQVEAWLRYGGRRAEVEARLGRNAPVVVSTPTADADQLAAAIDRNGIAAVAFTEYRDATVRLRVAVHGRGGHWQVVTLDRLRQPIWSPRVRVTRNGTIVATWLDVADPLRLVRVAVCTPQGRWRRPMTLEAADGLASVEIAAEGAGNALLAWQDTVGSEQRVRVATYSPTGWRLPTTVGTTISEIGRLRIAGAQAARVEWRAQDRPHVWYIHAASPPPARS